MAAQSAWGQQSAQWYSLLPEHWQCWARTFGGVCNKWNPATSYECAKCGGKQPQAPWKKGHNRRWGNKKEEEEKKKKKGKGKGHKDKEKDGKGSKKTVSFPDSATEASSHEDEEEDEDEEEGMDLDEEQRTTRKQLKALADARDAWPIGSELRNQLEARFNEERSKYNQEKPLPRQIAGIKQGITSKNKKIDTWKENVGTMETEIQEKQKELDAEREKIADMQLKVQKSEAELKDLEARKLQEEVAATPKADKEAVQEVVDLKQKLQSEQQWRMEAEHAQIQLEQKAAERDAKLEKLEQQFAALMQERQQVQLASSAPSTPQAAMVQEQLPPQLVPSQPALAEVYNLETGENEATLMTVQSSQEEEAVRQEIGRVPKSKGQYKKEAEEATLQRVGLQRK